MRLSKHYTSQASGLGDASVHYANPSVRLFGDEETWFEEFLSAKMVVAVVADINEAIEKINKYSGRHSAVIVTENAEKAERFMHEVDSAAVYHNASTRALRTAANSV